MLIIGGKTGQLGNRILLFAHFIGSAVEHGYPIANPSFCEYAPCFEPTSRDFFCRYPEAQAQVLRNPTTARELVYKAFRGLTAASAILPGSRFFRVIKTGAPPQKAEVDLASPQYLQLVRDTRYLVTRGSQFRDHLNFWKHGDTIRNYFRPVARHQQRVDELISAARQSGDLLVGVHIRQGDYIRWMDGRFFFTTKDYMNFMRKFLDLVPGRSVKFLICSNVSLESDEFNGIVHTRGTGQMIEDMYALARCDYLMGPPSTFTGWASFYGKVPLYRIREQDPEFTLQSFNVYGFRDLPAK